MAYVFRTFDKDGKPHRRWRFQYTDASKQRHTATGTASKSETERIAQRIEDKQLDIRKGYCPAPDPAARHRTRPYAEVTAEYQKHGESLGGRGGRPWAPQHARLRRATLAWWGKRLGLETLADLEGVQPQAEAALRELQNQGRTGKTLRSYAEALSAFCHWAAERAYLRESPVKNLGHYDITPRTRRRAMTRGEIARLAETCAPKRRLLHLTAIFSGLRASELRALCVADLDMARGGLQLSAEWTKNRRPGLQPLPAALLTRLSEHARDKGPGERLLAVPRRTAEVLRRDLRPAEIPEWTGEGRIDFHSLRVAFVTLADDSGANQAELMELARHSPPNLTLRCYARTRWARLKEIVETMWRSVFSEAKSTTGAHRKAAGAEGLIVSDWPERGYARGEVMGAAGLEPAASSV